MKNSEAEKKARIQAYVDMNKEIQSDVPNTFYEGDGLETKVDPSIVCNESEDLDNED